MNFMAMRDFLSLITSRGIRIIDLDREGNGVVVVAKAIDSRALVSDAGSIG